MDVRAIALDMDGTLLNSTNSVSPEIIRLLEEIKHKGIKVFLATGRTISEIQDLLPVNFPFDGAVTSNGMGCYKKYEKIFLHKLARPLVEKAINLARKNEIYYEMHSSEGRRLAFSVDKEYMKREVMAAFPSTVGKNEIKSRTEAVNEKIEWINDLGLATIVQLYFFSIDMGKINNWKVTLNEIKRTIGFTTSSSSLHNVEIMKESISKASGLQVLMKEYGIKQNQLMVYGDGENDIPMFDLAGCSVAMLNASEFVKEQANRVTNYTNDENGLYRDLLVEVLSKV